MDKKLIFSTKNDNNIIKLGEKKSDFCFNYIQYVILYSGNVKVIKLFAAFPRFIPQLSLPDIT